MSEFYLKEAIKDWDKRELVKFCLFCCYKVKHSMNEESLRAVELVEKWLEDKSSVSQEELEKAAYYTTYNCNADVAAHDTFRAAYRNINIIHWTDNVVFYIASAINSSIEALYIDYMRDKSSNIMEG